MLNLKEKIIKTFTHQTKEERLATKKANLLEFLNSDISEEEVEKYNSRVSLFTNLASNPLHSSNTGLEMGYVSILDAEGIKLSILDQNRNLLTIEEFQEYHDKIFNSRPTKVYTINKKR